VFFAFASQAGQYDKLLAELIKVAIAGKNSMA